MDTHERRSDSHSHVSIRNPSTVRSLSHENTLTSVLPGLEEVIGKTLPVPLRLLMVCRVVDYGSFGDRFHGLTLTKVPTFWTINVSCPPTGRIFHIEYSPLG